MKHTHTQISNDNTVQTDQNNNEVAEGHVWNEGKEKRWSQENDMEDSSTLTEMGSATFFDFDTRPFQQVSAQVKRNYLQ